MSLQLPKFASKKSSLDIERENFEKGQTVCLTKAINVQECAVKEKHVRSAIIGTYQEKGASTFWDCVLRLPLKENAIVCWKFCHVLHKVLREGFDNVVRDSQRFKPMLQEHGRFWGHLKSGYGTLVKLYCNLLFIKLNFHSRNIRIPGNLEMDDHHLRSCGADSEDAFFQLSVEMLDYLEAILDLETEIFKTMDSSKCNSMTSSGQCRLKPLIPCIQDSMLLYDYITKILFRLHAKLSPDLLQGHRERFLKVFRGLQNFYEKTMSLQYFKGLIEIQHLPRAPPNFLVQSDLENYETRKVVVYNSGEDITDTQSIMSDTISDLVDLQEEATTTNGSNSPDLALMAKFQEKERQVKEYEYESERLKQELLRLRNEAKNHLHQLNFEIQELKEELNKKSGQIGERDKVIENLKRNEMRRSEEDHEKNKSETQQKITEEKFSKLKDFYSKLRDEHVDLIRNKANIEKELLETKKSIDSSQNEKDRELQELRDSRNAIEEELNQKMKEKDNVYQTLNLKLLELQSQIENLKSTNGQLEDRLKNEMESIKSLELAKSSHEKSSQELTRDLELRNKNLQELIAELEKCKRELSIEVEEKEKKLHSLANDFGKANEEIGNLKSHVSQLQLDVVDNKNKLETHSMQKYNELLNVCIIQCEGSIKRTMEDLENPILTGGTGSLDHFILTCKGMDQVVNILQDATSNGYSSFDCLKRIAEQAPCFTNRTISLMVHGSATASTSRDIQKGDDLLNECRNFGASLLELMEVIKRRHEKKMLEGAYQSIDEKLKKLLELARNMGSSLVDIDPADALDKELHAMEQAIEEASKKMEEILSKSRASHTGVKLEVNEKLIDSCSTLMGAIRLLVQRAKSLQSEIVAQGRGSASVKEFYKRNHQWTEGLISAAKAVGIGAKFLLESADKAVSSTGGGFEFLVASSQEIAASTIQLVIASQVRAERGSNNMSLLKQASTGVKTATAHVIATAKDCAQLIEESDDFDVAKLSPHNAKRLELELQAETLRLESDLEKSRMKLSALRAHHYHSSTDA